MEFVTKTHDGAEVKTVGILTLEDPVGEILRVVVNPGIRTLDAVEGTVGYLNSVTENPSANRFVLSLVNSLGCFRIVL